jgi:Flp pilus assembly protein TadD
MRYVDRTVCALTLAALGACASNPTADPQRQGRASSSAPAATGTASPVDAQAQRAFDEARRAFAAGQMAQAERGFLALTQSNPELGGPFAGLGQIYLQTGKSAEAVLQFEAAVRANPKQPAYLNQLGVAYRQQGQFDKAREAYEQAISLAPDYAAPMLNLGILNDLYLDDGARALELYERYLLLTPAGDATVSKWVVELKSRKAPTLAAKGKP